MSRFAYRAFGLRLHSQRPIAALREISPDGAADVTVHWGTFPASAVGPGKARFTSSRVNAGIPQLTVTELCGGGFFLLRYADGVEFLGSRDGAQLWVRHPSQFSSGYVASYLLGPVLGFVLRLRGVLTLHASAVVHDGTAIAFLGPAGAGKSTAAAAFAHAGHPILTDDALALAERGDRFLAQPGYERIRLWPDSARMLFGASAELPAISEGWDKRELQVRERLASDPVPLGAILLLEAGAAEKDEIRTSSLAGAEALMTLVAHTYVNYLLDSPMRAEELELLGRLVSQVPVRRLSFPAGADALRRLPAEITAELGALCTEAAG